MADWRTHNELMYASLHPELAKRLRATELELLSLTPPIPIWVVYGLRTFAQQDALWHMGRDTVSTTGVDAKHPLGLPVTKCKGGDSMHNYALAADICPDNAALAGLQLDWNPSHPVWKTMLAVAKKHGLAEGADWRTFVDWPHVYPCELPANPSIEMKAIYRVKGLAGVAKWFDDMLVTNAKNKETT